MSTLESHPPIRAVILDLDGTMVESAPDLFEAARRMRAELLPDASTALTLAQIETFVGKGSDNLVRRVLELDLDAESAERMLPRALASYLRHYGEINGSFATVYPGVLEGVRAMRAAGLALACVTNKPHALAGQLLAKVGVLDAFDCVIGGDSLPRKKPDPLPMLHACELLGVSAAQTVAIGDSVNDAQAARAACCRVWIVPYGYNHGDDVRDMLESGLADAIVSGLPEAAERIERERLAPAQRLPARLPPLRPR